MDDREQLLDELARVYAHAAVDALLEQEAQTTTPATSGKAAGVSFDNDRNNDNAEHTRRRADSANLFDVR